MGTPESITQQMHNVAKAVEAVAQKSTAADMASALSIIGEVEKGLRKLRGRLMAAIVENAVQGGLPIK